jgi:hypothetical protein
MRRYYLVIVSFIYCTAAHGQTFCQTQVGLCGIQPADDGDYCQCLSSIGPIDGTAVNLQSAPAGPGWGGGPQPVPVGPGWGGSGPQAAPAGPGWGGSPQQVPAGPGWGGGPQGVPAGPRWAGGSGPPAAPSPSGTVTTACPRALYARPRLMIRGAQQPTPYGTSGC